MALGVPSTGAFGRAASSRGGGGSGNGLRGGRAAARPMSTGPAFGAGQQYANAAMTNGRGPDPSGGLGGGGEAPREGIETSGTGSFNPTGIIMGGFESAGGGPNDGMHPGGLTTEEVIGLPGPSQDNPYVQDALTSHTQQQALDQWLYGSVGQNQGQLQSQLATLNQQGLIGAAYQDYLSGNASQQYGISQGRSDLDRWRANQTYGILSNELNGKSKTAGMTWDELQRNVGANRGFVNRDHAIRQWLNGQNVGYNVENRDLGFDTNSLAAERQGRARLSEGIAAGGAGSRGHRWDQRDILRDRSLKDQGVDLSFRKTRDGLTAERKNNDLSRDRSMEGLLHQLNTGQISYQDAMNSIAAARASGGLARDYANKAHGYNSQQNALNRNSAVTGAQINYQQLMAQLNGQAQDAWTNTNAANQQLYGTYFGTIG